MTSHSTKKMVYSLSAPVLHLNVIFCISSYRYYRPEETSHVLCKLNVINCVQPLWKTAKLNKTCCPVAQPSSKVDTCRSLCAGGATSITIKAVCVEHSSAPWHFRVLKGQSKPALMNNPSARLGLPAAARALSVTSIICRGVHPAQTTGALS